MGGALEVPALLSRAVQFLPPDGASGLLVPATKCMRMIPSPGSSTLLD